MARIKWSDLADKASTHCVTLQLPGTGLTAKQAWALVARYLPSTNPAGSYALTISREKTGVGELWCGFADPLDAKAFSKVIDAQADLANGWATRHVAILDDQRLTRMEEAAPRRVYPSRKKKDEHRGSRLTARLRRWLRDDRET